MAKKALINYYVKLIRTHNFEENQIPQQFRLEVMDKVNSLPKMIFDEESQRWVEPDEPETPVEESVNQEVSEDEASDELSESTDTLEKFESIVEE